MTVFLIMLHILVSVALIAIAPSGPKIVTRCRLESET